MMKAITFLIFFYTWIVFPLFMMWVYFDLMAANPRTLFTFALFFFLLDKVMNLILAWLFELKTKMVARLNELKTKMITRIFGARVARWIGC
jgi:hypothetical protein